MARYEVVIETSASQEGFRAYATECPSWVPTAYRTAATRAEAADALRLQILHQFPGETFDFLHVQS